MVSIQRKAPPAPPSDPPRAPDGMRLYAIGDIHGRADLLGDLHRQIVDDARPAGRRRDVIVYLGDYVDRGGQSFEVVESLIEGPPAGFEAVTLRGNHEVFLTRFLEDGSLAIPWMINGGVETLESYGVDAYELFRWGRNQDRIRERFRRTIPQSHLDFFNRLETFHVAGDYLFVHAGIKPGVALDDQQDQDLMWIRNEFLDHPGAFPKMVVHGHSIHDSPDVRANRIGIDTGAYQSDRLTCLVVEGETRRFLQTSKSLGG